MKMDYTLSPDHLELGETTVVKEELVLKTGKVKRGDIVDKNGTLITDNGKVYGIVIEDADATTAETKTVVFVEGTFNINNVNYGSATKEKVVELCMDRNIYLKDLGGRK